MLKIIDLFHFFQFSGKYLNVLYTRKCTHLLISSNQSGFKQGDSCINQLLSITHDIYKSLDQGYEVRGVFLDISNTFGKVWHKGLIHKLKQNGIGGPLLKILTDFLKSRKQRVVLNGQHSSWSDVLAGVPEGSILSPLLFLIYIFISIIYQMVFSVTQNCL